MLLPARSEQKRVHRVDDWGGTSVDAWMVEQAAFAFLPALPLSSTRSFMHMMIESFIACNISTTNYK
jgi:hypothetical protein